MSFVVRSNFSRKRKTRKQPLRDLDLERKTTRRIKRRRGL